MHNAASDVFVSLVAPLCNDEPIVESFVREAYDLLAQHYVNFEIVLVDDGSVDKTHLILARLISEVPCLRILSLSRGFGRQTAVLAGLEASIGDYVAVIVPENDPLDLVPQIVERCRDGADVVVGMDVGPKDDGFFRRLLARIFHSYCRRFMGMDVEGHGDYRVLSRAAINALVQIKDRVRQLRHLTTLIGFKTDRFEYRTISRSGRDVRPPLVGEIRSALSLIFANSILPLRFASLLGLAASGTNLLYLLYVVAIYFFKSHVAEGWTTLSLQQGGMFFLIFVILTLLSEYVAVVLKESHGRPSYFIARETQSNIVLRDPNRRNVVDVSANTPHD
jgi:glycosyltransferase involved in cell wall biosynthesis